MTNLLFGLMALFGIIYTLYGLLLLLSENFLNKLSSTVWRETYKDDDQTRKAHFYNKYARGVSALIVGSTFTYFGVLGLLGL